MTELIKQLNHFPPGSVEWRAAAEISRLRLGLEMLAAQDYDAGYQAEDWAQAVLDGHEPVASLVASEDEKLG